jgi:hypothetical protein
MTEPSTPNPAWILVGLVHGGERLSTIRLSPLPFRVGRRAGIQLTLAATSVSREHAEFYSDGEHLRLRDLGSTNGTFVNRKRIQDQPVSDGDIVHFGECEFRVGVEDGFSPWGTMVMEALPKPQQLLKGTQELAELLRLGAVTVEFQPIVALPGAAVVAYEALGRGRFPGLSESPMELFEIGPAWAWSQAEQAVSPQSAGDRGRARPAAAVPQHAPCESWARLLDSVATWAPDQPTHHRRSTGGRQRPLRIIELGRDSAICIGLAYDDFGAGQAC